MADFTPIGVEAVVKGLAKFSNDLTKMSQSMGDLAKTTDSMAKELGQASQELPKADKSAGKFAKTNEMLTGALRRVGEMAVNFATRLPQMAVELVKLGASVERQANALDNMAQAYGTTGDAIVESIQRASGFTIDSMTAMQAANRAMLLDVAKSPDEFERLTNVAVRLGRVMGLDATQSINDFVTAAGRQSIMIADNLGLTIKVGEANERYAKQLGVTVGSLTKAEQKQAFLNAMLDAGEEKLGTLGESVVDTAMQIEQLEAVITDAKLDLAELAAEAAAYALSAAAGGDGTDDLASSTGKLTSSLQDAFHWFKAVDTVMREGTARGAHFTAEVNRLRAEFRGGTKEVQEWVDSWETHKLDMYTESLTEAEIEAARLQERMWRITQAEQEFLRTQTAQDYAFELANLGSQAERGEMAMYELADSVNAVGTTSLESAISVEEHQKALEAAAKAAEEERLALVGVTMAQTRLNEILFDTSGTEIAKIAIGELNLLLQAGSLTTDQYNIAVTQLQLTFGLTSEHAIGFRESLAILNEQLVNGQITAAEYDEALLLLTEDLPPTTRETDELARAMDEAAREAEKLTREAELTAAMAGDTFVEAAGAAIVETDTWSIALFEAADAAGADAQELALLAAGLGIYTDEQIEAALATVALSTTIDRLGMAIANGTLTTAEAIWELRKQVDLMNFSIGITDRNTSSRRVNTEVTRRNTKERRENAEAAREQARAERELQRALARTGDHFVTFISQTEMATEGVDAWAIALFEAADAAGADATELALLAGALGLYTQEQVEAALTAAALQEMIEQLGAEIAAGMGIDEAIAKFKKFRDELQLPAWLQPGSPTPLEIGIRGIANAMREVSRIELPGITAGLNMVTGGQVSAPPVVQGGSNITFGDTNINSGMDQAIFEERVRMAVAGALP